MNILNRLICKYSEGFSMLTLLKWLLHLHFLTLFKTISSRGNGSIRFTFRSSVRLNWHLILVRVNGITINTRTLKLFYSTWLVQQHVLSIHLINILTAIFFVDRRQLEWVLCLRLNSSKTALFLLLPIWTSWLIHSHVPARNLCIAVDYLVFHLTFCLRNWHLNCHVCIIQDVLIIWNTVIITSSNSIVHYSVSWKVISSNTSGDIYRLWNRSKSWLLSIPITCSFAKHWTGVMIWRKFSFTQLINIFKHILTVNLLPFHNFFNFKHVGIFCVSIHFFF